MEKLRPDQHQAPISRLRPRQEGGVLAALTLLFQKKEIRVEFAFSRPVQAENKWLFDELYEKRSEIEADFGHELVWLRLDAQKESRLFYALPCDGYQQENWPDYAAWHAQYIARFEAALRGPLAELGRKLKLQGTT
jgi:hypothetical protein